MDTGNRKCEEFLFKVRVADEQHELIVYACYAVDIETAETQLKDVMQRRGLKIEEIVYKKLVPQFASRAEGRRWWHQHGGNKELS